MADWTNLPNQAVGVGGLPSGTTVTALRDNPVAIAEGAPGAPKVQGVGLGQVFLGLVNTSGSSAVGFSDAERVEGIAFFGGKLGTGAVIQIRFSNNNGSSWGSWQTLVGDSGTGTSDFVGFVDFRRNRRRVANRFNGETGGLTIPSGMNAFQIRSNGGTRLAMTVYAVGSE